jgi:hypothetical protein
VSRALVLVALASLLVVGCAGAPPSPAAAPAPDRSGAPIPPRSLDVSANATQPCVVLTEDQLRSLELVPNGRIDPLPIGVACVWEGPGFGREVSVTLYADRDLLVDSYRSRSMYQYFEPVAVAGLPATAQQTTRGALTCTVTTGVAVGQAVDVSVTEYGADPDPPCESAIRVSEVVVGNLPEPAPK